MEGAEEPAVPPEAVDDDHPPGLASDDDDDVLDSASSDGGGSGVDEAMGAAAAAAAAAGDDDDTGDTSAEQAEKGRDPQGIPWDRLRYSRSHYRLNRLQQYQNFLNVEPGDGGRSDDDGADSDSGVGAASPGPVVPDSYLPVPDPGAPPPRRRRRPPRTDGHFYGFRHNYRGARSSIVHFQLRHLVWATSKDDAYVMHDNAVYHHSSLRATSTEVLNLNGASGPDRAAGRVMISTTCVHGGLVIAGGFAGELVAKRLGAAGPCHASRLSADDNAITNAVVAAEGPSGALVLVTANNDCAVRATDAATFARLSTALYAWPVNYAAVSPNRKLMAVAGDDPVGLLTDAASGRTLAELKGHRDFSFSAAWHPAGNLVALGNQDATSRVWDVRYLRSALHVLRGRMGAIRSLRFSADGGFLAAAEPADFVHVFDASAGFAQSQVIDLFGEIAGVCFSPESESLYVGVADAVYGSLMEFDRTPPVLRGVGRGWAARWPIRAMA